MQYSNSQDIIKSTSNINAERIDLSDKELLLQETFEISSLPVSARDNFEVHVYTPDGTYLTGDHALVFTPSTNISDNKRPSYNVQIDLKNELNKLNIKRGQYKVVVNFLDTLLGNINEKNVWVKEISQSKTEIKISIPKVFLPYIQQLLELRYSFHKQGLAAPIVLNFGNNRIYPVVNFKLEPKYDLSDIIRDSVPQSYINQYPDLPEDKILQDYAYRGVEGNLLRESDFKGQFGQYYVIQNNVKRSFNWNDTLLFEFAKYFESSRFDFRGKEIRKAHPYIELGGNGLPQPKLLDLYKQDLDNIASGPDITLVDLIGNSDYYTIIFKLYKPLDAEITEKTSLFVSNEYREPYTDTVYLIDKSDPIQYNHLRPANFNVDAYSKQSIPTEYKNWNELLDANLTTSQRLIDSYFSGSLQGIPLNVNFGEFENFVHFSSAVERIKNFKYKLELIEYYTDKITSLSGSLYTNLTPLYTKRNAVVSTFDNFEKYLFYDSGSLQLYTHVSYSIDPWPKKPTYNLALGIDPVNYTTTGSDAASWTTSIQYGGTVGTLPGYNGTIVSSATNNLAENGTIWISMLDSQIVDQSSAFGNALTNLQTSASGVDYTTYFTLYPTYDPGNETKLTAKISDISIINASGQDWLQIANTNYVSGNTWDQNVYGNQPFSIKLYWNVGLVPSGLKYPDFNTPFNNLYRVSESIAETYYADLLEQATIYDHYNVHRLLKAVPLHIRMTEGNEDFNVFVDMLGHHYDIIWTYINHMSKIFTREEHPQDGMSGELIYHAAKSLGFQLYNGRSTTELWKYVYGVDNSGSLNQEGVNGVYSLPDRQVTQEYWRRLLNNLPYLLKTKGTERSIKALLSCFGIPSTLLTIKEFGGPSTFVEEVTHYPEYVHDKFTWAYKCNTYPYKNYIQVIPSKTNNKFSKDINAIEFRFRTDEEETYKVGTEYNLFSYNASLSYTNGTTYTTAPNLAITIKKESATDTEGTLTLRTAHSSPTTISNVNIFDNNFNLIYLEQSGSKTILKYRKAKYGKIVETGSASITDSELFNSVDGINTAGAMSAIRWGNPGNVTMNAKIISGSVPVHIHEIRFWSGSLNNASLEEHALSANTYTYNVNRGALTGNEALEPYNRLVQRYTLSNKHVFETSSFGFSTASLQLSAHPNQTADAFKFASTSPSLGGAIWLVNASGSMLDEVFDTFEETYYTPSPSLGGNSLYTNKVRIEQNSLTGFLSPYKRVEASSYDKFSIDSAKIGIYFSPQDSINEDIFNQLGYYEIDDYIGNPADIYGEHYPEFEDFASDYWLKYNNKNDFEAFFRVLSIYDSTIFRYIKDMLPFRANIVDGFLIEPNALERKRFRTTKPTIDDSMANVHADIQAPIQTQEAFYLTYEGGIEDPAPDVISEWPAQTDAILDINEAITPGGDIQDLNSEINVMLDNDLDILGSSWTQNRYIGQYKVGGLAFDKTGNVRTGSLQTETYTPMQTVILTSRYEVTTTVITSASYSASLNILNPNFTGYNTGNPYSYAVFYLGGINEGIPT